MILDFCSQNRVEVIFIDGAGVGGGVVDHLLNRQIEKKADMKRRRLASPDIADALALTFARPVFPRAYDDWMAIGSDNVQSEYDVLEHDKLRSERSKRRPPR
jgi:hypothetical protein